jgi:hypothetical protein
MRLLSLAAALAVGAAHAASPEPEPGVVAEAHDGLRSARLELELVPHYRIEPATLRLPDDPGRPAPSLGTAAAQLRAPTVLRIGTRAGVVLVDWRDGIERRPLAVAPPRAASTSGPAAAVAPFERKELFVVALGHEAPAPPREAETIAVFWMAMVQVR